jgi:diguanylate cyclase (GGDEF)-like protein
MTMALEPTAELEPLYDPLTGLPGTQLQRAHLAHALRRAVRSDTQVAVLFLDIDNFQEINERLGPDLGDAVLIVLAARVQACLRDTDLTARVHDDELAVVCGDLHDPADVTMLARRVREALAVPVRIGRTIVIARVNVGTASTDGSGRGSAVLTGLITP